MPSSFGTLRSVSICKAKHLYILSHSLKLSVQHGASIPRMPRSVTFFELWKKMHWLGRVPIGYVHSSTCACVNGTRLSGTFLTDVVERFAGKVDRTAAVDRHIVVPGGSRSSRAARRARCARSPAADNRRDFRAFSTAPASDAAIRRAGSSVPVRKRRRAHTPSRRFGRVDRRLNAFRVERGAVADCAEFYNIKHFCFHSFSLVFAVAHGTIYHGCPPRCPSLPR